jgi:cell division protein FtsW
MARTLKSDKLLFVATLLLVGTSILMVYSASSFLAMTKYHQSPYYFLFKQLAWSVIGLTALAITMKLDYRVYRHPAIIWFLLIGVFIALVAVLFMPARNGTTRWFGIGSMTIQPSEFAKITLIIFSAALLERRMHRIADVKYSLGPILIATGLFVGLVLKEPDFGTSVAILTIVGAMIFSAGLAYKYLVGGFLLVAPPLVIYMLSASYRRARLLSFLDPWADQLHGGYQVVQSMIAIGSGGIFGRGLMASVAKQSFLPEPHTDFIASIIGEELGLVGITLLIIAFLIITWRGLRAAVLAPDRFGTLLGIGLTTMIAVQAFINLSVVTGLFPNKGMPLPFVSNGGSSLVINLLGMGILLNISQQASTVAAVKTGVDPEALSATRVEV